MKKFLAIMGLMLAMLVPVSIAAPAQAADCHGTYRKEGTPYTKNWNDTGWVFKPSALFYQCDRADGSAFYRVTRYELIIDHVDGTRYCNDGKLTGWKLNPNVLAGWNPGEKYRNCVSGLGYYLAEWNAPGDYVTIYESMSDSDKCINTHVTYDIDLGSDIDFDINTLCFNNFP